MAKKAIQKKMPNRYFYIVKIDDETIKVGITIDPENRFRAYKINNIKSDRVLYLKKFPYRCARCLEYGMSGLSEWSEYSNVDNFIKTANKFDKLISIHKCNKSNHSHKGQRVSRFMDKCYLKFTDHNDWYFGISVSRISSKYIGNYNLKNKLLKIEGCK